MGSVETAVVPISPVETEAFEAPIEASFIVRAIWRRLDDFGDREINRKLSDDEAAKFHALRRAYDRTPQSDEDVTAYQRQREHLLSNMVDLACWDWARDPVMYGESIELRSFYFARKLILAASLDQHVAGVQEDDDFRPVTVRFPYAEDETYYSQVDQRVARHISNVVLANPATAESLVVPQDEHGLPLGPFALIKNNRINRSLTFCPNGKPNMASYQVLPIGYPTAA